jgi:hypothetical protein
LQLDRRHDVIVSVRLERLQCQLPAARDQAPGRLYAFRGTSRGAIIVSATANDRIFGPGIGPGVGTVTLPLGQAITLISDGDNRWFALSDLGQ